MRSSTRLRGTPTSSYMEIRLRPRATSLSVQQGPVGGFETEGFPIGATVWHHRGWVGAPQGGRKTRRIGSPSTQPTHTQSHAQCRCCWPTPRNVARTGVACGLGVDLGGDAALHLLQEQGANVDQRLVDLAAGLVLAVHGRAAVVVAALLDGDLFRGGKGACGSRGAGGSAGPHSFCCARMTNDCPTPRASMASSTILRCSPNTCTPGP